MTNNITAIVALVCMFLVGWLLRPVIDAWRDARRRARERRLVLPIASRGTIPARSTAMITVEVLPFFDKEIRSFRPERFVIAEPCLAPFEIDDIKINGRSQFSQRGAIPARLFAAADHGLHFGMDALNVDGKIDFVITNTSDTPREFRAVGFGIGSPREARA